MRVEAILKAKGSEVATALPDASVGEIARILSKKRIGVIVVCGKKDELLGIVSERDIVRGLASIGDGLAERPVSEFMSTDVKTCSPSDNVGTLMETMTEHRIRHLPVMADGRLCGIVSIGDVVKWRVEEIQSEAEALRTYVTSS